MYFVIRTAALLAAISLSLILSACNADQITLTLQAAIVATELALPALNTAGDLSPVTVLAIHDYLNAVNDGAIKSTNILADNGYTPAEKATAITAAFTAIALPKLPPGTPQNVTARVNAVAGAVDVFLRVMRTTQAEIRFTHPDMVTSWAARHKALTAKDLATIRKRAERAKRKIASANRKTGSTK